MINFNDFSLRPLEEQDLEWLRRLRNDESTWTQLGTFTFLYEITQREWFASLKNKKNQEYLIFQKKNLKIGIVRLTDIDLLNRSICVGGDIDPKYRGKGYAKIMYQLIFKLGFEIMGMHRLWLFVLDANQKAIHIYKKSGFKEEGCQREAIYRNGKYHDYLMMAVLEDEYFNKLREHT